MMNLAMLSYVLDGLMLAEYIVAGVIIFILSRKSTRFDFRKPIGKKTFLKRLIPLVIAMIAEIAVLVALRLVSAYAVPMYFTTILIASRLLEFPIDVFMYVVIGLSWFQRYVSYPRGLWLAFTVMLMFIVSNLFMPWPVHYGVLIMGFVIGWFLPEAWNDGETKAGN
jgi:hypothetical protein